MMVRPGGGVRVERLGARPLGMFRGVLTRGSPPSGGTKRCTDWPQCAREAQEEREAQDPVGTFEIRVP